MAWSLLSVAQEGPHTGPNLPLGSAGKPSELPKLPCPEDTSKLYALWVNWWHAAVDEEIEFRNSLNEATARDEAKADLAKKEQTLKDKQTELVKAKDEMDSAEHAYEHAREKYEALAGKGHDCEECFQKEEDALHIAISALIPYFFKSLTYRELQDGVRRAQEAVDAAQARAKQADAAATAAGDTWYKAQGETWNARKAYEEALETLGKKTCPEPPKKAAEGGGGGGKIPEKRIRKRQTTGTGQPFGETISRVVTGIDSNVWCTYGDGTGEQTTLIVTDENGVEIKTTEEETPQEAGEPETPAEPTPETPTVSEAAPEQPPVTPETPTAAETKPEQPPVTGKPPEELATPEIPKTAEKPPEEPTTPKTPETTEKPPEEPLSEIPDTIFVKAKEEVLEGKPTGSPIENQVVKLFPPEEPALPGTDETTKETEDTGFDKDPVECTTGAEGDCSMHVPPEDRAQYDLPANGASKNYRADYDLPKDSGGVAETTGKPAEADVKSGTPPGAKVTYEKFSIGDRSFVRLVYKQAYGLDHNFGEQFKPVFGDKYEEDYCRDKQPGPPLGMQPSTFGALNHDLPEASIKLGAVISRPGDVP